MPVKKKILLLVHEGNIGLGHVSRMSKIARSLDAHTVTLATAMPDAAWMKPPQCAFAQAPSWKMYRNEQEAQDGRWTSEIHQRTLRSIESWYEELGRRIQPDVILVDYLPFGVHGELEKYLSATPAHKVLLMRGVIDSSDTHLLGDAFEEVGDIFDRILVACDERIVDVREYGWSERILTKVEYVGYVASDAPSREAVRARHGVDSKKTWVVCSAGSGHNAELFLQLCATQAHAFPDTIFDIVYGPFARSDLSDAVMPSNCRQHRVAEDLPNMHAACDVAIINGGYNSLTESMRGARVIVFPNHRGRDDEQSAHAYALAAHYPIIVLQSPEDLPAILSRELGRFTHPRPSAAIPFTGLARIKDYIESTHPSRIRANARDGHQRSENGAILYSVVVPTFNRSADLRRCLDALAVQTSEGYEIIVVDDGSGPETKRVIDSIIAQYPHKMFVSIRLNINSGCAKARNAGINAAKGNIILFTDDDCVVPKNWVETHVDAHARYPEAAGVGGWYWPSVHAIKNAYDRFFELHFELSYPNMRNYEVWTNTMQSPAGNTANMSYKTKILRKISGFDEKFYFTGGIDWELKARCIALGYSLVSIPLSVEHSKYFTLKTFLAKTIKLGRGLDYMSSKYPSLLRPSVYYALSLFARWKSNPITRGERAGITLLWASVLIVGKIINRITRFFPAEVYQLSNLRYFSYRIKDGRHITTHELLPFDPYAGVVSEEKKRASIQYSVVIPTFNRRKFVHEAARAVLDQEKIPPDQYELIVVDDGSTDDTQAVIRELQEEYVAHTIVYHYQENKGASIARNAGVTLARGSIIFFTDSDCVVQRTWLWTTLQAYRQHPEIMGTGGAMLMRRKDATLLDTHRNTFSDNRFVSRYRTTIVISNDTTSGIIAYDSANMSVRAEAFKRVGGFFPVGLEGFGRYHEDVDFACRIQNTAGPMALVPNTFAFNVRLLSLSDFRDVAYMRGATLPALIERISPSGNTVCEIPLFSSVVVSFLHCLLRPFNKYGWITLLHTQSNAAGYRAGSSAFSSARAR